MTTRRTPPTGGLFCGHCANFNHAMCFAGKLGCACADQGHEPTDPELAARMARYIAGANRWANTDKAAGAWYRENERRGTARPSRRHLKSVRRTRKPDPTERPLFVYGTLRRGHALQHGYLPDSMFTAEQALAAGSLHYVHHGQGYPVFDPDGDGVVVGEVVRIRPERARDARRMLARTLTMEEGAGYTIEPVEVLTYDGRTIEADVCAWRHEARGDRIESGDWSDRNEQEVV